MLTLLAIAVPLACAAAWWAAFRHWLSPQPGERVVYAGLATAAQIVLTETLLGATGQLRAVPLLAVNGTIAAALALALLVSRRAAAGAPAPRPPNRDLLSPSALALLALLALVSAWLALATWYLPPRGIDDLVYHLPPLYHYAQTGRITLLPLELREVFAMPLNADFLYLWPLVVAKSDRLVDGLQFIAALYGACVLHALACRWQVARREAAFVGLSFVFLPVVLAQSGSNYIDVIVAAGYLALLYGLLAYRDTGETLHVTMAGVASGLLIGAKYTVLPLILALQPLLVWALLRHAGARAALRLFALHWSCALPFFAYWYARNFVATGHAFYPFEIGAAGLAGVPGTRLEAILAQTGDSALAAFIGDPWKLLAYPFSDPGLGSFHGGFGLVFWGLGLPALVYCLAVAIRQARQGDWFGLGFWAQWLVLFAVYLPTVREQGLQYDQRYIVGVAGLGLVATGVVLARLCAEWPAAAGTVRGACVAAAALAVVQMGSSYWPSYRLDGPAADALSGEATSEYEHYRQSPESPESLAHLSVAWEPLDFLTAGGEGWSVYMAADYGRFWTTPLFGSRLQNSVWNFQPSPAAEPDAFVYTDFPPAAPLVWVGRRITPAAIANDGAHELVAQTRWVEFWVRRERLEEPAVRARLTEYYRRAAGPWIAAVAPVIAHCPADATLLAATDAGPGLRYLSLSGRMACPVHLVRPGWGSAAAAARGLAKVITLGMTLPGYESRRVTSLGEAAGGVAVYENLLPP